MAEGIIYTYCDMQVIQTDAAKWKKQNFCQAK